MAWEWVRLSDLSPALQNGASSRGDAGGELTTVIRLADIRGRRISLEGTRKIPINNHDRERYRLQLGDILITRVNGSADIVGQFNLCEEDVDAIYCDHFIRMRVRPDWLDPCYCAMVGASSLVRDQIAARFITTAGQKTVNQGHIGSLLIPLPPLGEQARIVARVDELMRLCDALEAKNRLEAEEHARLVGALLGTLTDSATPEELTANWQRLAEHFDVLLDRPESVAALERAVLTLAVRGLLVPQFPTEEPAVTLIDEISEAIGCRIGKPGKPRTDATGDVQAAEGGYPLPQGWAWARLGEISINRDGERVPVSASDRESRRKIYDYYGASGVIDKIDGYLFDKTLLLIGEDGANLLNRSTPIAYLAHGKYWVNNHAHVIDATHPELLEYLELFINAISLEPYVTGTAQPKMNQAKLNSIPIALPPLAEQGRILRRVAELRRISADLRQRLVEAQTAQSRLAHTLVEPALK